VGGWLKVSASPGVTWDPPLEVFGYLSGQRLKFRNRRPPEIKCKVKTWEILESCCLALLSEVRGCAREK